MKKSTLAGTLLLVTNLAAVSAAEITTCIIDTSDKTNPVLYYFPIAATKLRCDHAKDKKSGTLADMYKDNWRLVQVIKPVLVDQGAQKGAYTPPVIYLERTEPPAKVSQKGSQTDSATGSTKKSAKKKRGGLFNWLGGDSRE